MRQGKFNLPVWQQKAAIAVSIEHELRGAFYAGQDSKFLWCVTC